MPDSDGVMTRMWNLHEMSRRLGLDVYNPDGHVRKTVGRGRHPKLLPRRASSLMRASARPEGGVATEAL